MNRSWTPEETSKLEELKAQGFTPNLIVGQLKFYGYDRSYDSVDAKFHAKERREKRLKRVGASKSEAINKPELVKPSINIDPPEIRHPLQREENLYRTYVLDTKQFETPIIKVLGLFDSHYPETIRTGPLLNFLRDYNPDLFILGGDNWSLDCISHWNKESFMNWGMDNILAELRKQAEGFAHQIRLFMAACPKAKFVYLLGNHERWLHDFVQNFPQIRTETIKTLLGTVGLQLEFIPQGCFYQIGKLHFCHGDQIRGGQNPAKWAVEKCHANVVFGHFHTRKEWPDHSMVDSEDKRMGIQVPCYTTSAPDYGKGSPNQIQQGFFTASIKKDSGKFSHHVQLVSPKGEFMSQMGIEYN